MACGENTAQVGKASEIDSLHILPIRDKYRCPGVFQLITYFAFAVFASLDAGLGRKEDAIREALRAVDLLPIAKDSYWGPPLVTNLALVCAWTGERDRAIEQLEIVAKVPNGPSYGDLKFNPCWDSLRGDPRFEKIVASLKPKD